MATTNPAGSRDRLNELFEAALLLPPAQRNAFLVEACADDPRLRAEVLALLARAPSLSQLGARDRQRISGLFHAALALTPDERRAFLGRACADRPTDRQEIESLLVHAQDSEFLAQAPVPAGDGTRLGPPANGLGAPPGAPPGGPPDRFLGRKVRDYVILRRLGEGGMGVVYLALDTKLEKHVAIKVVRPEYANDPDYRRRLVSEAQLAARLSHPNIATVYALFEEGPDLFVVSEYVAGPSLREELSHGPLEYARLLRLFTGIARGLEAAHTKAIIHRDLKPDNILLTEDDVPKIVDFGLAKSTRAIIASTRMVVSAVDSGTGAGTPAYMAPEQVDVRPGPLDFRCDLFAFGVTLYEAATGINPFAGRSLWTTLDNIRRVEPPPLARPGTALGHLDAIVQRCLRKDPRERYESTKALVHELEELSRSQPVPSPPPPPPPPPPRSWTWWEVHQLSTAVFYAGSMILLWLVHTLARPRWASLTLMFAALVAGALLIVMRAHYLFASRQRLPALGRTRIGYRRIMKLADWALSAIFAMMAGLMLYVDRPGTAAPLLIIAVVNALLFLVVEPVSEADAFPDGDEHTGGESTQTGPPVGGTGNPTPAR